MATITLRSVKGSPLTNNEVDNNFDNLNLDKLEFGDLTGGTDIDLTQDSSGNITVAFANDTGYATTGKAIAMAIVFGG